MAISVSFPFSWAAQLGVWGPSLSGCWFCRLWNGMFNCHWAEITVMQFTGHSLPVHQFVTVPWDFNPVPYCQPSSPTPTEYALPPSLEWHVWPGRKSIYYTSTLHFVLIHISYLLSVCIFIKKRKNEILAILLISIITGWKSPPSSHLRPTASSSGLNDPFESFSLRLLV